MALASLAAHKNKAVFATLLVIGVAAMIAGVVLLLVPSPPVSNAAASSLAISNAASMLSTPPLLPPIRTHSRRKPKSILKKSSRKSVMRDSNGENGRNGNSSTSAGVGGGAGDGGGILAAVSGLSSPPPAAVVTWSDSSRSNKPLESVMEFQAQDAPATIASGTVQLQAAHDPKAVPMRVPYPVYAPLPVVAGYMPAAAAPAVDLATVFNPAEVPPSVGGAVYYKPPSKYPTVGEIAEERNRFWSKPETPDIDRHRRLGQLRDYALTMRPQRSGAMIPVAVV